MTSINVIPVRSTLSANSNAIDLISRTFLENINDNLLEDDISLVMNAKNALFDLFLIETGGSEFYFLENYKKIKAPCLLLSTQENNSLAACFEIKTFLESKDIPCLVMFGNDEEVANYLKPLVHVVSGQNKISKLKLGVVGKPSDWLIASTVDYQEVKKVYGISLVDIEIDELKLEYEKHSYDQISRLEELNKLSHNQEELKDALYVYGALKRIIKKYKLDGLTIRCFDLISSHKVTACLALSLLNEEGYIAGCEGDIPSLITMAIVNKISGQSSFMANPSKIDFEHQSIILSHCTVPFNMCKKYSLSTHFESGISIGIKGQLHCNKVTICKFGPKVDDLLLINAKIKENLNLPNYCRTQIALEVSEQELLELINRPFGNHLIVTYSDIAPTLSTLMSYYSLKTKKNKKK